MDKRPMPPDPQSLMSGIISQIKRLDPDTPRLALPEDAKSWNRIIDRYIELTAEFLSISVEESKSRFETLYPSLVGWKQEA